MARVNVVFLCSCCNYGWRDPVVEHVFVKKPSLEDLDSLKELGLDEEDKIKLITQGEVVLDNKSYYLITKNLFTNNL